LRYTHLLGASLPSRESRKYEVTNHDNRNSCNYLIFLHASITASLQSIPLSTDIFTPTLASVSTPTTTLILLPMSTTTAAPRPILEIGLPPSPTITPNATQAAQQEDIKNGIQAYFEIRYRLLSVSPPADIHIR